MTNIHIYLKMLMTMLVMGITTSCVYEDVSYGENQDTNVTLTLSLGQGSRAITNPDLGVENLNENKIETVDLFFYLKDAKATDNAVYSASVKLTAAAQTATTVSLTMPMAKFNSLFESENVTDCKVYAIANRPASNTLPVENNRSMEELKTMVLHAPNFAVKNETDNCPSVQANFVMAGEGTCSLNVAKTALSGAIQVERVAAKISLCITGIENVVEKNANGAETGYIWKPVEDSETISLRRASVRTYLGAAGYPTNKNNDIFQMENLPLNVFVTDQGKTTSVPFYTYPTNWKEDENSRTHVILTVTWNKYAYDTTKKESTGDAIGNPVTTFYEVNINPGSSYTERNRHYQIMQEISVLGSTDEETAVELDPTYQILGWGEAASSSGDLNRIRYLVVDETFVTMENVVERMIYFTSSDPVYLASADVDWESVSGVKADFVDLATQNNSVPTTTGDVTYTIQETNRLKVRDDIDYKVYITIHNANKADPEDRSWIKIEHNLDNSMDGEADFTRYRMVLNVAQTVLLDNNSNVRLNQRIEIMQYPMLCVVADQNYDYSLDGDGNNAHYGYVYINGYGYGDNGRGSGWAYVGGWPNNTAISSNPNKYIISVTSLPIGAKYLIGDPRSKTPSVPTASNPAISNSDKQKLVNYYPADRKANSQLISPQFMVASSYGFCNYTITDMDAAESRCATYQEDGYPAGRWRVPTQAEVEYIIQLSAWNVIPTLFSVGEWYWSAQGCVQYQDGKINLSSTNSGRVRCVYDTWYWGTEKSNRTQYLIDTDR